MRPCAVSAIDIHPLVEAVFISDHQHRLFLLLLIHLLRLFAQLGDLGIDSLAFQCQLGDVSEDVVLSVLGLQLLCLTPLLRFLRDGGCLLLLWFVLVILHGLQRREDGRDRVLSLLSRRLSLLSRRLCLLLHFPNRLFTNRLQRHVQARQLRVEFPNHPHGLLVCEFLFRNGDRTDVWRRAVQSLHHRHQPLFDMCDPFGHLFLHTLVLLCLHLHKLKSLLVGALRDDLRHDRAALLLPRTQTLPLRRPVLLLRHTLR
mmetsp:Transcript_15769/g.37592  ORF Transcript_15769/g.37592 Transcript_15769/m.37592 type:complete len:258 (-) Transcript_15769:492-1265(-)